MHLQRMAIGRQRDVSTPAHVGTTIRTRFNYASSRSFGHFGIGAGQRSQGTSAQPSSRGIEAVKMGEPCHRTSSTSALITGAIPDGV